uniref:Uncharacterized protein LOC114343031 n=1 Tax=Diabrotica virgifera virgifera TaxID=50390 RepID=A0A6P7GUF5_DIAVI
MHCLLLGVMKRMLWHKKYGWIFEKPPFKLQAAKVHEINLKLAEFKRFIPYEFSRKTRSIVDCKRYKATEFRLLLLYTGIIAFKEILPKKFYNNFLCLSLGTIILCSAEFSKDESFVDYANDLFTHFIKNSIKLYNPDFVSFNVHNMLHIADCVKLYGMLDNFSAFPFENYMPQLTKKVRKAALPLEQVVKRIFEQRENPFVKRIPPNQQNLTYSMEHSSGPLPLQCRSPQYKVLKHYKFYLNTSKISDRFVELDNNVIMEVKNMATYENTIVLIGFYYKKIAPLFKVPIDSLHLGISFIEKVNVNLNIYSVSGIRKKIMVLPFKNRFVCFPILHHQ